MNAICLRIAFFSLFFLPKFVYSEILPAYDNEPITPYTWKKISLEYQEQFGTIARIDLLRPNWWLEKNHANKVDDIVHLNIPEFGVDVEAKVTKILPVHLDTSKVDFSKDNIARPVIGKFVRHVEDVWSYQFSDGKIVEATPNHRFYSATKNEYIPISEIKLRTEKIFTASGKLVTISEKKQLNKGIHTVYNMEVYQRHNYFVGDGKLLAHNGCIHSKSAELPESNETFENIEPIQLIRRSPVKKAVPDSVMTRIEIDSQESLNRTLRIRSRPGENLFILTKEKLISATQKNGNSKSFLDFHHPYIDLESNNDVIAAGEIFRHKQVTYFTNRSGNFPGNVDRLKYVQQYLNKHNINTNEIKFISFKDAAKIIGY
jgi:Pretoxin HINT domain